MSRNKWHNRFVSHEGMIRRPFWHSSPIPDIYSSPVDSQLKRLVFLVFGNFDDLCVVILNKIMKTHSGCRGIVTPDATYWGRTGHYEKRLYSENAQVCAKWQWNARDCVTGLHDRRSRECNPVTPVECVSLSFRTHPRVRAFIIYILCTNAIDMALV